MVDLSDSELRRLAAGEASTVQRMAAELLRAREALAAADRLADAAEGSLQARTGSLPRALGAYLAARRGAP